MCTCVGGGRGALCECGGGGGLSAFGKGGGQGGRGEWEGYRGEEQYEGMVLVVKSKLARHHSTTCITELCGSAHPPTLNPPSPPSLLPPPPCPPPPPPSHCPRPSPVTSALGTLHTAAHIGMT